MKRWLLALLDRAVPSDLKEFEEAEELVRARALVFFVGTNLFMATLGALTGTLAERPPYMPPNQPAIYLLTLCGYTAALWTFRRTGLFVLSANLYALTCYLSIFLGVVTSGDNKLLMLLWLVLPVALSLIASHRSALVWLLVIAVSPPLATDPATLPPFFFTSWLTLCLGLLLALSLEYVYREHMRRRLSLERSHFEYAAAHDPLTGLENRATFDRRFVECIRHCTAHGAKAVLLYLDLDHFKAVNDNHGHQAGDAVLVTVARRMRELVRSSDTVARLGGDEFAILFSTRDPKALDPVIDRLGRALVAPIEIGDAVLSVGCSMGRVVWPDDGRDPEQLARKADQRMYAAKRGDRTRPLVQPTS